MLLKTFLFITSFMTTSITAISVNTTEIESKEFCVYTYYDMIKMIDPYYIDSSNNKIYFDNIEEYARYIGPNWFGVSYCGNNTVVNNIGEYFSVTENANYEKREIDENTNQEELKKYKLENELNLFGSRSYKEYKEKIKSYYDGFIKNGLKSIALSSKHNPAYNPYHPALIKIENINPDEINFITTMGYPYEADKSVYEDVLKNNKPEYDFCASLSQKGGTITCSVAYTDEVQNTLSISNGEGSSYHKSAGKIHTVGDTVTDEINRSIELALALTVSNSTNGSTSKGFSKSFETVHNVINTTSNSTTNSTEDTETNSVEKARTHMVSEEHAHAVTHSEDVANETNWSKSSETSTVDEYTRMKKEDFENYKDLKYIDDVPPPDNELAITKVYHYFEDKWDSFKETVNEILDTDDNPNQGTIYRVSNPYTYHKRSFDDEVLPIYKYSHIEKRGKGGGSGGGFDPLGYIFDGGELVVNAYGAYLQDEANVIQRQSIHSEEQMSVDQSNLEIQLGLAGQHTSGTTTTNGGSKGGSKTTTKGWADCVTDTSGINDGWTILLVIQKHI